MLSNPRTPQSLSAWAETSPEDQPKDKLIQPPSKAHVTNHNAYASLQGWAEWLRASIKLSHAVMLRPVT